MRVGLARLLLARWTKHHLWLSSNWRCLTAKDKRASGYALAASLGICADVTTRTNQLANLFKLKGAFLIIFCQSKYVLRHAIHSQALIKHLFKLCVAKDYLARGMRRRAHPSPSSFRTSYDSYWVRVLVQNPIEDLLCFRVCMRDHELLFANFFKAAKEESIHEEHLNNGSWSKAETQRVIRE